jgi:hypothetical protein
MVKTARMVPRTGVPRRVQRTAKVLATSPPLFGEIESTTRSVPWLTTVETDPGPTAAVVVAGTAPTRKTSASKTREAATALEDRAPGHGVFVHVRLAGDVPVVLLRPRRRPEAIRST